MKYLPTYPSGYFPSFILVYVLHCANNISLICLPIPLLEYKPHEEMTNPSCLLLYPQGEDTRPGTQQRPDSSFWKEREANPKTLARLMLCGH